MEEADEEKWDLDEVMTAAEVDGSAPRRKFHELQTDCQAVQTELLVGLVDVV